MLHVRLRFPEGVLHIIAIYGVSSPTQTARKEWTSAALAEELRRVVRDICAGDAWMVIGDLNTVSETKYRKKGRLQPYDGNPHALWRVL